MSARIVATGVSQRDSDIGSIDHAVRAGRACIDSSGIAVDDIDLLINLGVYRDRNLVEPSGASLIERKLGMNLHPGAAPIAKTTFSFDLVNGSVGFLNAVQLVSGLMTAGVVKNALLVSSEAHPSKQRISATPLSHVGAAVLLAKAEDGHGFGTFQFKTSPAEKIGVFGDVAAKPGSARHLATIEERSDDAYFRCLEDFVVDNLVAYLASSQLDPAQVTLVISEPKPEFAAAVGEAAGIPADSIVNSFDYWGDTLSSALLIGANQLGLSSDRPATKPVLFVASGAGMTAGLALYKG